MRALLILWPTNLFIFFVWFQADRAHFRIMKWVGTQVIDECYAISKGPNEYIIFCVFTILGRIIFSFCFVHYRFLRIMTKREILGLDTEISYKICNLWPTLTTTLVKISALRSSRSCSISVSCPASLPLPFITGGLGNSLEALSILLLRLRVRLRCWRCRLWRKRAWSRSRR